MEGLTHKSTAYKVPAAEAAGQKENKAKKSENWQQEQMIRFIVEFIFPNPPIFPIFKAEVDFCFFRWRDGHT